MNMKTAIVVGANGFLGSKIVNELLNKGVKVFSVYNFHFDNINKESILVNNDQILNSNIRPDYFFFAAGNYSMSHEELLKINHFLFQCSLKFFNSKFIYISSTEVYGNHNKIITERTAYNNPGLYAQSKLFGEFIVSAMPHFSIIRLTYIYGPGITNNSFIPQIIYSAKNLGQITLYGNGSRVQDYIYIDDAVDLCIVSALINKNAIYLGATGKSVSNKKVAEEIKKWIKCSIRFMGEDFGQSFQFNPKKTQLELNWFPRTSFYEGIKKMLT